jgi:hypothetical protein
MSSAARELLVTFEALDPAERQEVAAEILRRAMGSGELDEAAYDELSRGIFNLYEKEESGKLRRGKWL